MHIGAKTIYIAVSCTSDEKVKLSNKLTVLWIIMGTIVSNYPVKFPPGIKLINNSGVSTFKSNGLSCFQLLDL